MAAPLYSRYIPPKRTQARPLDHQALNPVQAQVEPAAQPRAFAEQTATKKRKRAAGEEKVRKSSKRLATTDKAGGEVISNGQSISAAAKVDAKQAANASLESSLSRGKDVVESQRHGRKKDWSGDRENGKTPNLKVHKSSKEQNGYQESTTPADEVDETSRHASIMSKYARSLQQSSQTNGTKLEGPATGDAEPAEVNDLVPIPRPQREAQLPAFTSRSALPSWLSTPVLIKEGAKSKFEDLALTSTSMANLHKRRIEHTLPIQSGVLPLLLPRQSQHPGDLCVSAATGSGKTLAYVLPIVESLVRTRTCALRALIVVPTRELVAQVHDTAEELVAGTDLKITTATGVQRLEDEQRALISTHCVYNHTLWQPSNVSSASKNDIEGQDEDDVDDLDNPFEDSLADSITPHHRLQHFSKVDILICTPGRLVDHIKRTRGFSLAQLEWLVIDEADRLLDASFQEWVETLNGALQKDKPSPVHPSLRNTLERPIRSVLRKVILSATITRDLEKLGGLRLRNPRMVVLEGSETAMATFDADHGATAGLTLPSTIFEYGVPVGEESDKPLYLLHLMDDILKGLASTIVIGGSMKRTAQRVPRESSESDSDESDVSSILSSSDSSDSSEVSEDEQRVSGGNDGEATSNLLIFVGTNESAHRLAHLIQHMRPALGATLSTVTKTSGSRRTARTIAAFQTGKVRVLIATDRASRGLDLPTLSNVINYDMPHSITSYVHRIGRTARAGRDGSAWTLIGSHQARWFWKEVARGDEISRGERAVRRVNVRPDEFGEMQRANYADALKLLQDEVNGTRERTDV